MNRILSAFIASLFVLLSCSAAFADTERRYTLADHGAITLKLPDGWVDQVRRPRPELPPTIIMQPAAGAPFQVLITPIWPMRANTPKLTLESLSAHVRSAAEEAKSQSVEKDLPLQSLSAPGIFGAYFSATDRAAKPGEFEFLTQGMLSLADLSVTFTILTNRGQEAIVPKALAMLKSLRRELQTGAGENESVRLSARVDMHISKGGSTPQDEVLFKSFLHSVSFQPKPE